jgi:hypothetical protein
MGDGEALYLVPERRPSFFSDFCVRLKFESSKYFYVCNYSAPIHQDGKKPVLFVPHFFSGASWLFAELAKTKAQGPQTVRQF